MFSYCKYLLTAGTPASAQQCRLPYEQVRPHPCSHGWLQKGKHGPKSQGNAPRVTRGLLLGRGMSNIRLLSDEGICRQPVRREAFPKGKECRRTQARGEGKQAFLLCSILPGGHGDFKRINGTGEPPETGSTALSISSKKAWHCLGPYLAQGG